VESCGVSDKFSWINYTDLSFNLSEGWINRIFFSRFNDNLYKINYLRGLYLLVLKYTLMNNGIFPLFRSRGNRTVSEHDKMHRLSKCE
jgi:hypothetical protein